MTAWWDASQIYGYDETSLKRVMKDPEDPAKLLMRPIGPPPENDRERASWKQGYLPVLDESHRKHINPLWEGQEATAFPDNWSIGLSFFHNVFAREHNKFVDYFRSQDPKEDSGLRRPNNPNERPKISKTLRQRNCLSCPPSRVGRDCKNPHDRMDNSTAL